MRCLKYRRLQDEERGRKGERERGRKSLCLAGPTDLASLRV
jgi:hypothetical protein